MRRATRQTTDKGKPPKRFYLGFDPKEAQARKMRLEQLWGCVLKEKGKDARWCGLTLAIAGAIAKGQHEVAVDDWLVPAPPIIGARGVMLPIWRAEFDRQQLHRRFPG